MQRTTTTQRQMPQPRTLHINRFKHSPHSTTRWPTASGVACSPPLRASATSSRCPRPQPLPMQRNHCRHHGQRTTRQRQPLRQRATTQPSPKSMAPSPSTPHTQHAHTTARTRRWHTLKDLGISGNSMVYGQPGLLANQKGPELLPADQAWLEYDFATQSTGTATLAIHLLPTFALDADHHLRFAVQIDGNAPTEFDASDPQATKTSVWQENVLRNSGRLHAADRIPHARRHTHCGSSTATPASSSSTLSSPSPERHRPIPCRRRHAARHDKRHPARIE